MCPNQVVSVDTDVDLHGPGNQAELRGNQSAVLAVIAVGGALGALARYGVGVAWPHPAGGLDWAILAVNVSGCLLIGVLMVLVTGGFTAHRLLRPFLGVGVLGGYTTFSASVVDVQQAAAAGHAVAALGYLASTLVGAMLAVWVGTAASAWLLATRARKTRIHTRARIHTTRLLSPAEEP